MLSLFCAYSRLKERLAQRPHKEPRRKKYLVDISKVSERAQLFCFIKHRIKCLKERKKHPNQNKQIVNHSVRFSVSLVVSGWNLHNPLLKLKNLQDFCFVFWVAPYGGGGERAPSNKNLPVKNKIKSCVTSFSRPLFIFINFWLKNSLTILVDSLKGSSCFFI